MEKQPQEAQKPKTLEEVEVLKEVKNPQNSQQTTIQTSRLVQIRQAPLPSPEELRGYKSIDKSIPGKIVSMAEKEQSFRHWSTYFGQANFVVLVAIGYGLAAFAGIMGADITGGVIAVGVSYVVYAFKSTKPEPPKPENQVNSNKSKE